jgi:acyl dehydratase
MDTMQTLKATNHPAITQVVSQRDAILYALGIGMGDEPLDPKQLKYVYEKDFEVFPTMAITLCYPGSLGVRTGMAQVDVRKTLHVFQGFELHNPIPLGRPLTGKTEITNIYDKGAKRGILWTYENRIADEAGTPICTLHGASMCSVGGGVGGPSGESKPKRPYPKRAPDLVRDIKTLPQAALIYRLSGDYNPFHVDPDLAAAGGFSKPILHGRCTFGIAGRSIVDGCASPGGKSLQAMEARFTSPVLPGETIRTEIWNVQNGVMFRSRVRERDILVLDQGFARLH